MKKLLLKLKRIKTKLIEDYTYTTGDELLDKWGYTKSEEVPDFVKNDPVNFIQKYLDIYIIKGTTKIAIKLKKQ